MKEKHVIIIQQWQNSRVFWEQI